MSICGYMDKQIVVYTYNGILLSYKKNEVLFSVNEPWKHAKRKKSHMYDSIYRKYPGQINSQRQNADWWLSWTGGEESENRELILHRYKISLWVDEMFWTRWRWQLHNILNVLNATESFTFKRLILCEFHLNEKKVKKIGISIRRAKLKKDIQYQGLRGIWSNRNSRKLAVHV